MVSSYFPLLWFPLQLFHQLDPPRSLSVFLRNMLLVVAGLCQETASQFAESCCSWTQSSYPAIDLNRAPSSLVSHQDAIMGWRNFFPLRPSYAFQPRRHVSHSQVFFALVGVCKMSKQRAVFQRRAAPSALFHLGGPGVAFPAQVTRKKYGLMKEEAFLEPPVMCRRVFMSRPLPTVSTCCNADENFPGFSSSSGGLETV